MDFVKREDSNIIDEANYKAYMDAIQKSHQMEVTDYQHTPISMEQLHQAMHSSLNHNFQLPISPRQMSTLMLKSNHITRSLNFNEIPHLQRTITEIDLAQNLPNDLPQNLGRHDDLILNQNIARNLDVNLARTLTNELDMTSALPNSLVQSVSEDLDRNLAPNMGHLSRISDVNLQQSVIRTEGLHHIISNDIDCSRPQEIIMSDERRTPVQCEDDLIGQQRLDQHLAQRLDQILVQRIANAATNLHDIQRQLETNDQLMQFQIKAEQEDDGYFYENINQGIPSSNDINGHIPLQQEHPTNTTTATQDHMYCVYTNQMNPVPALNPIDLYSRPPNYVQNYATSRDNPQNLVVQKFDNPSPYQAEEFKKLRQDEKNDVKNEDPKENMKPSDQNKMYYDYQADFVEKNESTNKLSEDLSMSIKGEYICYKCSEVFPSKRALKQHGKGCDNPDSESAEKSGKFTCTQCPYRCQSPAILKIHERTHTGEKPYSCTFCDYKSGQKNNVAKHILVHMKEKPFRCQYCQYRCAQKNNLVVHERTHTGYKPFACPYCDYRTVQKPNLVKHMYLHTDQKPFSCDMCNYRCVQKTNLTKHKQKHLNEKGGKADGEVQSKPYQPRQKSVKCPYCTYRYVRKSSLEKHLQFKHPHAVTESGGLKDRDEQNDLPDSDVQNLSVKKSCDKLCETVSMQA